MFRSALVAGLSAWLAASSMARAEPSTVSFRDDVAPILVRRCLGCHNARKAEGGLNMTTPALLRKGGETGGDLILEPGEPESSLLVELVRPGGAPRMPYKQPRLTDREIATLELWIKGGARFDVPSETETSIASLVDPLRGLPAIAPRVPAVEPVTSLAFRPDGKVLAAAVGRGVVLYDADRGTRLATLADHPGPLTAVRITPDGKTLVAVGGRPGMFGSIAVWDLATRSKRFELRGHGDSIQGADVDPGGKMLATASYDRQVGLWDLERGKELRRLKDHTDAVYAVAFSPDGRLLASAGADRTVKLWDLASGRRLTTFSDATAELYAVVFGPAGQTVLAGGVDRSIHVWRVDAKDDHPVHSVFAHDAAILRLVVAPDGKTLVSSGEDRDVKLWDLPALKARAALSEQSGWPQGLAVSPDGSRVAVGRDDGSLSIYERATGTLTLNVRGAPGAVAAVKPELVRNATLSPPAPRGAARGSKLRITLTGNGVGRAVSVLLGSDGLAGTIVPAGKPNPNRLDVDLTVAADARVGLHRIGVVTPLGVPPSQPFAVSAHTETAAAEPDDDPRQAPRVALPATLVGAIDRPGDVDRFRFQASAGERLVFETVAKALGSKLVATLSVLDDAGRSLAEASALEDLGDPVLTVTVPRDGTYVLAVADADYGGSAGHFYRIAAGPAPYLTGVFPLGVAQGRTSTIELAGLNLQGVERAAVTVAADAPAGSVLSVPVVLPDGTVPINQKTVVVGEGPQAVETEPSGEGGSVPQRLAVPGGVSGRMGRDGDTDLYTFEARKGQRLIVEVFGRRLGTSLDPVIEILDARGTAVPRAVLRPLDQTEVAFRDHDSSRPGVRLTRWNNLAIDDYVLIGRELARIRALPRNPDDDCVLWSEQNQRLGFLETTTEHHPMSQPIYKVAIHPPGATFPAGGVPPVTLTYRNDDGGPGYAKDSRVTFIPPADGLYQVRVEDVRGLGGESFGYHLVVRVPHPDFRLTLSPENPNIARGGTTLVTASLARIDGFDDPVEVVVEGLPPGVRATPARIERGDFSASLALTADISAPAFSPPTWKVTGRAVADRSAGSSGPGLVHHVDPGGPDGGRITVTPTPNLTVEATPTRVTIRPGHQVAIRLAVRRSPAFAGRVPIEVRNLPLGVRVLNIGLNGVLITEKQSERTVQLYAEPWVGAMERPFYAVGKAEAAGTEHSSPPIGLVVDPGTSNAPQSARRDPDRKDPEAGGAVPIEGTPR